MKPSEIEQLWEMDLVYHLENIIDRLNRLNKTKWKVHSYIDGTATVFDEVGRKAVAPSAKIAVLIPYFKKLLDVATRP